MKNKIKLVSITLIACITMISCGTKERSMADYQREAEIFKSELPESYVVLGECIDSLVQKIYYTNRVSPWEEDCHWQDCLDEIDDDMYPRRVLELQSKDTSATFIKVYNINTHDTSDIDFSKVNYEFDWLQIGIRFKHYANGKLYFSVPEGRYGSSLYYINVYTDDVDFICGGRNFHVEGDKIVYTANVCINPEDVGYKQVRAEKELSIDL